MNKNTALYFQVVNFWQLTRLEFWCKNLNPSTPDVVISHQAGYKLMWKINPCCSLSFGWFTERTDFMCRRFGILYSIFISGVSRKKNQGEIYHSNLVPVILPACTISEDGIEYSETSEYKIQTPENRPKERMQHSEQDESLKSRKFNPPL